MVTKIKKSKPAKDQELVMTLVTKYFMASLDELPDISKKTMRVKLRDRIGRMGKLLEADFKVLADHLVSDTQICNQCGNQVHLDRYATYPWANVKLPKNFGRPVILEQVYQEDSSLSETIR